MNAAGNTIRKRVVILGAAGRDFHNFNVVYREDRAQEVLAFTATQIDGIAGRRYPAVLAGANYPKGIPIIDENELEGFCLANAVDEVVFAYSDVSHETVMHLASRALASGAKFTLLGPQQTMLQARVPVIAVCAVRTGCGKSQVTRWLAAWLRKQGFRVSVMRHPMPYGDLASQAVQRLASRADLDAAHCTVEEREEYEPHIDAGCVVHAGVDYEGVLVAAELDTDVILWDGGNNDFPFVRPNTLIVLVDAVRPGHESAYHPGETVLRMADIVVLAKCDAAAPEQITRLEEDVRQINARALIVRGASPVRLDNAVAAKGKQVLVIEDGPTTTHGGMPHGAGYVAARAAGAAQIVDPRPYATAAIAAIYKRYPHLGSVLPALGYAPAQLAALCHTINAVPADIVVSATPVELTRLATLHKPVLRARYDYADFETPGLAEALTRTPGPWASRP